MAGLFRTLERTGDVERWIAERAPALRLKTEIVPIGKTDGWGFTRSVPGEGPVETTALVDVSRQDRKFFQVAGAKITREVDGKTQVWGQPLIVGSKPGHVGFLRVAMESVYLIQLLAEAGNMGAPDGEGANTRVLIASTFQASPDNVDRALSAITKGGDLPPAVARYVPLAQSISDGRTKHWPLICEDGGRFYEKRNYYGTITARSRVDAEVLMAPAASDAQDFAWIHEGPLQMLIREGLLNSHGVQAYGITKAFDAYMPVT